MQPATLSKSYNGTEWKAAGKGQCYVLECASIRGYCLVLGGKLVSNPNP